jgi:hypothetical protein
VTTDCRYQERRPRNLSVPPGSATQNNVLDPRRVTEPAEHSRRNRDLRRAWNPGNIRIGDSSYSARPAGRIGVRGRDRAIHTGARRRGQSKVNGVGTCAAARRHRGRCYLSAEGVVFGADSTSTMFVSAPGGAGGSQHHYNFAQKIFQIGDHGSLGIAMWGLGNLLQISYRTLIARFSDQIKTHPASPPCPPTRFVLRW